LNLTQTLWNGYPGGPTQAVVDKSLLTLKSRQLATDSGRLSIVFRVKQAYYTMLAAQQNADVTRQILDKQNGLLAQITAVYNLRQASDVDLHTAQINARSAQVDVENADHTLRISRIQLAILMGRPTEDEFSVAPPDPQPLPAAGLSDAISQALSRRTDFQQLELSRRSNQVDLTLARGQGTPTVSVTGGVAGWQDWNNTSAWLANAGVKVAMPILDAGAVKNLVDAALKQDQILALQERQLQKSIAATIQSDWEAVQIQNERVEVARLTAENDDRLVDVYRIQNQNGTASTQDLLTASVNAASAHTAYVQAQSSAQLAVLQLLSDMGY
jgi:cobalt-zinc-cadmium efflux system outer membrane protein